AREVTLAAAESERRKKDDESFVDALIADGKLRPTEKTDVLAELAALDDGAPTIELAAGDDGQKVKLNPRQAYRRRLSAAPKLVELGKHGDPGGPGVEPVVEFAAPDGYQVDHTQLDLHARAQAYQRAHPGTPYLAAVKAVSK
ncbi:MAG TPA: hypothetical protein VLL76_10320, partial [Candidatus Omnitrophota bacterium]|nr:hypothetical protein [Candidatus Omnitrophota bacterium]